MNFSFPSAEEIKSFSFAFPWDSLFRPIPVQFTWIAPLIWSPLKATSDLQSTMRNSAAFDEASTLFRLWASSVEETLFHLPLLISLARFTHPTFDSAGLGTKRSGGIKTKFFSLSRQENQTKRTLVCSWRGEFGSVHSFNTCSRNIPTKSFLEIWVMFSVFWISPAFRQCKEQHFSLSTEPRLIVNPLHS